MRTPERWRRFLDRPVWIPYRRRVPAWRRVLAWKGWAPVILALLVVAFLYFDWARWIAAHLPGGRPSPF